MTKYFHANEYCVVRGRYIDYIVHCWEYHNLWMRYLGIWLINNYYRHLWNFRHFPNTLCCVWRLPTLLIYWIDNLLELAVLFGEIHNIWKTELFDTFRPRQFAMNNDYIIAIGGGLILCFMPRRVTQIMNRYI